MCPNLLGTAVLFSQLLHEWYAVRQDTLCRQQQDYQCTHKLSPVFIGHEGADVASLGSKVMHGKQSAAMIVCLLTNFAYNLHLRCHQDNVAVPYSCWQVITCSPCLQGGMTKKLENDIAYPQSFNFSGVCGVVFEQMHQTTYALEGALMHEGKHTACGHYWSVFEQPSGAWELINDSIIQ